MYHIKKINGNEYLYKNKREGGRVVTRYWGRVVPELWEVERSLGELEREIRESRAARRREARERSLAEWRSLAGPIDEFHDSAIASASREMQSRGYHRHARSPWRKRRCPVTTPATIPEPLPPSDDRDRADAVDVGLGAMIAMKTSELFRGSSPDHERLQARFIRDVQESIAGHRRKIAGPGATELERMLASDISLQMALIRLVELRMTLSVEPTAQTEADYAVHERRIDRHRSRMHQSIRALDALRRTRPAPVVAVQIVNSVNSEPPPPPAIDR